MKPLIMVRHHPCPVVPLVLRLFVHCIVDTRGVRLFHMHVLHLFIKAYETQVMRAETAAVLWGSYVF